MTHTTHGLPPGISTPEQREELSRIEKEYFYTHVIFSGDGEFSATRLDNLRILVATSPAQLHDQIRDDLTECPFTRAYHAVHPDETGNNP